MRRVLRNLAAVLLTGALVLLAAVVLGFAGAFQFLAPELPDAAELRDVRVQLPLQIYSADGRLMAQIGEQRRIPVAFAELPPLLVDAFLAAEDERFFQHPGVDWQGLLRALASNLAAGDVREGGGTITMQLARNTFLTPERTLRRKLKEIFLALRLEREFDKREILTLYLNRIFLGQRAYGVGAAAEVYYGKRVGELGLAEAALIAGLPRSPSRDNPVASPERARERRAYVLRRLLETQRIDADAYRAALEAPVPRGLHAPAIELDAGYAAEMARAEMIARYGPAALTDGYRVVTTVDSGLQRAADAAARRAILEYERRHGYRGPAERLGAAALADAAALEAAFKRHPDTGGLLAAVVIAARERSAALRLRDGREVELDWPGLAWARPALPRDALGAAPQRATDVLAPGDCVFVEPLAGGGHALAQLPAVGGALVALRPQDGAILALSGGFDFRQSKYNRATQAKRQPGSAFKPFLYSAALERGFTPATLVNDAPIVIQGATADEDWRPQNISKRFYGPTRVREALVRSRNLVSIRLLRSTGVGPAIRHMAAFGFDAAALPGNLTLALGTGQVSPLAMARGFAVFANGGFRVEPYLIARITDSAGRVVQEAAPPLACPECLDPGPDADPAAVATADPVPAERRAPRAISAANAYVMTDMMADVIQRGTAQLARSLGRGDVAGKTGTTNDRRDTWFVGFNPELSVASWIGFDQERSLGEQEEGGKTALPMWVYFMEAALAGRPERPRAEPPGLVRMWVSRASGRPTRAGAPDAVSEVFLEAFAPQAGGVEVATDAGDGDAGPAEDADSIF